MNLPLPSIALPKIETGVAFNKVLSIGAPVGAIAICVLTVIFVIWPKFTEVLKLSSSNNELSIRSSELSKKAAKLSALDREGLNSQLLSAEQLLPSDKSVFTLVSQIEKAAKSSGVLLDRVDASPGLLSGDTPAAAGQTAASTPAPAANAAPSAGNAAAGSNQSAGAPQVELKVATTSDYKSLLQFLGNILAVPRVLIIKDLSIASSSAGSTSSSTTPGASPAPVAVSSQVRASLVVDAYWQPLPKELNSIESPISDLTPGEIDRLSKVKSSEFQQQAPVPASGGKSDLFAPF